MREAITVLLLTQFPLIEKHPAVRFSPLLHVDVAPDVLRIDPLVMVMPLEEARPAAETPPENVEVPADVTLTVPDESMPPPVIVMPLLEESPFVEMPPVNVEVALEVAFTSAKVGEVVPLK